MIFKSQADKAGKNNSLRVVAALFCAAAVCAVAVLAIVPAVKYRRAAALSREGDSLAAYEIYKQLGDYRESAALGDEALSELCSRAVAERNYEQFDEYYALISSNTSKQAARGTLLETAESLYAAGRFESAYECCMALEGDGDAEAAAERCRSARYDELVEEYTKTASVPQGFEGDMLRGYLLSESYAVLFKLQNSPWVPGDETDEIALVYSLGDFLGVRDTGFAVQRLYGNSYTNDEGYYFRTGASGDWEYNLPYTKYSGYYGLYTKLTGNTLLTGSDEKQFWTPQFDFSFADLDRTLHVYCRATGGTITLTKER